MTRHRLNPLRLRAEIHKRGLDGQTFAAEAGISAATLSHVIGGRSANPRTLTAIVRALARIPVVDGLDQLLEEMPVTTDVQRMPRVDAPAGAPHHGS
ncbi:MAG: helix-turn-helix transcriptional regulator [Candidatus Dormibacter sp.]